MCVCFRVCMCARIHQRAKLCGRVLMSARALNLSHARDRTTRPTTARRCHRRRRRQAVCAQCVQNREHHPIMHAHESVVTSSPAHAHTIKHARTHAQNRSASKVVTQTLIVIVRLCMNMYILYLYDFRRLCRCNELWGCIGFCVVSTAEWPILSILHPAARRTRIPLPAAKPSHRAAPSSYKSGILVAYGNTTGVSQRAVASTALPAIEPKFNYCSPRMPLPRRRKLPSLWHYVDAVVVVTVTAAML